MERLTPEKLESISKEKKEEDNYIKVGLASCGIAAGAEEVFNFFAEEIKKRNLPLKLSKCGCLGSCFAEPLVEVKIEGLPRIIYGKVNKEVAAKIMEKHILAKMLVNDNVFEVNI